MSHRLIRRAAILLVLLLVLAAMAFSINTTQRERRLAARTPALVTGPVPAAYDARLAAASFESRCTKCHEIAEMHEWLAANAGADREGRLVAFLQTHRKAPDAESEAIARFLSESPGAKP